MKINSEKSFDDFIQRILGIFVEIDLDELKKDMIAASLLKDKTKFINLFLKDYSNSQLNQIVGKKILYDIISKLVYTKEDFMLCMEIYLATEDKADSKALRHHYILKEEKLTKVTNGDEIVIPMLNLE